MQDLQNELKGQANNLPLTFLGPRSLALALAIAVALAFGLGNGLAHAQGPELGYDEDEAQAIDQMLMCPVCPAESIDQAQVPLARQMRQRVREMLAEGATREEVLAYFADRYGQSVLASPPKSGFSLLAWTMPVVGVVGSLIVGALVLRSMTGRGRGDAQPAANQEVMAEPDEELSPYLAAVDLSLEREQEAEAGFTEDSGLADQGESTPST